MSQKCLVVPDTNLFFQCRKLHELKWRELVAADEVALVISNPVQMEIDKHKAGGNQRRARRARETSAMLKDLMRAGHGGRLPIATADVTLWIEAQLHIRPTPGLDYVNYDQNDGKIAAIAHAIAEADPSSRVVVLTDDGGLQWTARSIGIEVLEIPQSWFLPPEPSDEDREIRRLKERVSALETQGPELDVFFVDEAGAKLTHLSFELPIFEPLTSSDIRELVWKAKNRFPAGPFELPNPPQRILAPEPGRPYQLLQQWYLPAQWISDFQRAHNNWLEDLKEALGRFHNTLRAARPLARCRLAVQNTGVRPAEDTLVSWTSGGPIEIASASPSPVAPANLPAPPIRPEGVWLSRDGPRPSRPGRADPPPRLPDFGARSQSAEPDPNVFHLRTPNAHKSNRVLEWQCKQWRHGGAVHQFDVKLLFKNELGPVSGSASIEIHAKNLSIPLRMTTPINADFQLENSYERAEMLIESLVPK